MKRSVAFLALCAGLVAGAAGHAREIEGFDVNAAAAARGLRPELAREAARASGVAASIDDRRGVPSFLWATGAQPAPPGIAARPDAAARHHLARFARAYGLTPDALATAEVAHVHDLGRGAVVVTLRQRLDGVEVYRNDAKVVMRQDLSLVAITGNLHPEGTRHGKPGARTFTIQPTAAVSAAVEDLYGLPAPAGVLKDLKRDHAGYLRFGLEPVGQLHAAGIGFTEPARVKKVFFPVGERLVPAYFVEVYAGKLSEVDSDYVRYVIAAKDGRVLYRQNLTAYEAFSYRVWSEPTGTMRPLDGPIADFTPHPTGTPDGSEPAYVAPELVSMEGFNTNPSGGVDPWLPATAVQTLGNNVDAYMDHNAPDGYSNFDLRATTTAPQTFDRVYDVNQEPVSSTDQVMAATTQLFFVNNWLHDYFYDSGFNEAAGNAQASNYGRGGVGGDVLRAEAQDGAFAGNRNNANMSTPADGASPRMQMYLWASNDVVRTLTVQPLGLSPATGTAGFGPNAFNITGELALIDDAAGASPTDGCEDSAWTSDVTGRVALIDRGGCSFKTKIRNAQQRGAIGVLVANNLAGNSPMTMGNDATITDPITIPSLSIGNEDGATLKAALLGGPQTVAMQRQPGIERDGTIDNAIVAHEWGHYFHHRLSDCGGTQTCGALSEGWADFIAQHMVIREGDNLDGTFALAIYSTKVFGDSGYFGIRRAPYTTDTTKNALTFQHIQDGVALPMQPMQGGGADNFQVHNAGEIWSLMLFEAYRNLLLKSQGANPTYTFEEARRLMADYIVAGLKAVPVDATYTETRDAILAAAYASNPDDAVALAQGFAKRGAGSCAVAPPRFSGDLVGVVESMELRPKIEITAATIDDGIKSCDSDGVLDGEEIGLVRVEIRNPSVAPLVGAELVLATTTAGVSFPAGDTLAVPDVPPFGTVSVELEVALDESFTERSLLDLQVTVSNAEACVTEIIRAEAPRINLDDVPASSATDSVESASPVWVAGTLDAAFDASNVWAREQVQPDDHIWYGVDYGTTSDTWLTSPELQVSASDPLVITFEHAYQFETTTGANPVYWDGGLIEISDDGGTTWQDISAYADPGYVAAITTQSNNPLAARLAFVGQSAGFPALSPVTLDLGTALANKTVQIRFRIGTDVAAGDIGWLIDNLAFQGITNTPFGSIVDDEGLCQLLPVANAGEDQTVDAGEEVTLDASESTDPNNDPLTFAWEQVSGPSVTLDATDAIATFTAPSLQDGADLTFRVAVSDGQGTTTDMVTIKVLPTPDGTGGGGGGGTGGSGGDGVPPSSDPATPSGGCGCFVAGDEPAGGSNGTAALGALAALGLLVARRRRGYCVP